MANTNVPRIERIEKVWTPDAKLYVPHREEEIGFATPAFGPDTYLNGGKLILGKGLKVPTGDYAASLVHTAYCNPQFKDEPEFSNVRDIMRANWLWVFNQNLWTSQGVYVTQDLEAKGRSESIFPQNELEKMILISNGATETGGVRFSKDRRVRFAPKATYQLGDNDSKSLSQNGFVIASYGVEGAQKLGEVSATFANQPYIYGLDVKDEQHPELRVSALDEDGERLLVNGDNWYDNFRSHAFGVL